MTALRIGLGVSLALLGGACSAMNRSMERAFGASHAERMEPVLDAQRAGLWRDASEAAPTPDSGADGLLKAMEQGTALLWAAAPTDAMVAWGEGAAWLAAYEDRPVISGRGGLEHLGSLVLNDRALPYDGETAERILLHVHMALARLLVGDDRGARIELRVADRIRTQEGERLGADLDHPLVHVLSGWLYETRGRADEARIDYRRALAVDGSLAVAREGLDRTRDGRSSSQPATVLLVASVGRAPVKVEERLNIPTHHGAVSWTVPAYRSHPDRISRVRVLVDGVPAATAEVVLDVDAWMRQSLRGRLFWMAARSAARAAAKAELVESAEEKWGTAGAVLGSILAMESERADLRSWLTLPRSFAVARVELPTGEHEIGVEVLGPGGRPLATATAGRLTIRAGDRVVLACRAVGPALSLVTSGHPAPEIQP